MIPREVDHQIEAGIADLRRAKTADEIDKALFRLRLAIDKVMGPFGLSLQVEPDPPRDPD
jgi:hypothetical protein